MSEQRLHFDRDIHEKAVLDLANADSVAAFFAHLGYPVEGQRIEQTAANLDITAESTLRPIRRIELLANFANEFQVYLFEVTSVTIAHRNALVRVFRNRSGNFLLVVTSDYERIDFVLVETYEAPGARDEESPFHQPSQKVRPRAHTVERRKPTPVDLRVLRRFTWTEEDGYAQYGKLRSAFEVATWSEDEFNNRALFSDHYLKTRLPKFPDWRESPKATYRELHNLFRGARGRFGRENLEALRQGLLNPALETLGFTPGPPPPKNSNLLGRPLLAPESDAPLAWCLDFPWGRALDTKDPVRDQETGEVNPGVAAVDLLGQEDVEVPWIILTNGQVWRLYSRQAHSRATNYYEIDAEEVLSATSEAAADPRGPFRYFWLLFRRQAFEERTFQRQGREVVEPLVTHLWVESGEYARQLGDRLKEKIFDEVFETLAQGFLASRGDSALPSQEELDEAFEGTLTFLYRLLFLLFAEARDLLPVRDVRGYYKESLSRLKGEVATAAGSAFSQADAKLEAKYGGHDGHRLYDRLMSLFEVVDRGAPKLNVPTYNGGLFLTEPPSDDSRSEARAARFLRSHHVADLPLARALDRLARNEDEKASKLVFIDYKSLGVRQLGSIYEGLLEFRLRIASEPMAIVKGKKAEQVVPLAEARDKGLTILRNGRAKDAPDRVVPEGEIYLENDKRERRATGSYYTPDFVVEYIVRKTVGPLLEDKLEALRPRLREAESWHRRRTKEAQAKGEAAAKYEAGPAVEERWRQLVDDAFDLKILDPAMGSGHFLVEAVDFVTDEILGFLHAFPWNPVFAHLQHLRDTILREMEAQEITIDTDRLTDTHLLKRHVLKRCIFGVDLNPMAVELAKVSLWLDCFTLGAPLSFLDHHLRCGNSLVGATVEEVDQLRTSEGQLTLSGTSDWQGLLAAVEGMLAVGGMPDTTPGEVAASEDLFSEALSNLAPFKEVLDIYTAQWFVDYNSVLHLCLRSAELFDWAQGQQSPTLQAYEASLDEALAIARGRRFFHWQMEFPEVFFTEKGGKGFDVVIGNPPYVRIQELRRSAPDLADYIGERYKSAVGNFDIYLAFLEAGLRLTGGEVCFVVSNKWFSTDYGKGMRDHLREERAVRRIVDFRYHQLFEGATNYAAIVGLTSTPNAEFEYTDASSGQIGEAVQVPTTCLLTQAGTWSFGTEEEMALHGRLVGPTRPRLGEYLSRAFQGLRTSDNESFVLSGEARPDGDSLRLFSRATGRHHKIEAKIMKPLLSGDEIRAFSLVQSDQWLLFPYGSTPEGVRLFTAEELQSNYPLTWTYLGLCERRLRARESGRFDVDLWWQYGRGQNLDQFEQPKIMLPDYNDSPSAALDEVGIYYSITAYCITLSPGAPLELDELVALLNSDVLFWLLSRIGTSLRGGAVRFMPQYLKQIPLPGLDDQGRARLRELARLGSQDGFGSVRAELNSVVGDLYALSTRDRELVRSQVSSSSR